MKKTTIESIIKTQKKLNDLLAEVSEDEIPADTMLKIKKSNETINNIDFSAYEYDDRINNSCGTFFQFCQNNSGGYFDSDDKICHRLFIEASNIKEAKARAMELGVYFDGVSMGMDCSCCGDRWSSWMDDDDIMTFPYKYEDDKEVTYNTVEEYAQHLADRHGWTTHDARIFYREGRVVEINGKSRN